MLSKTFGPIVFPAVRTQNSSPKPVSNKISGQTLESEQLSTMAYGFALHQDFLALNQNNNSLFQACLL